MTKIILRTTTAVVLQKKKGKARLQKIASTRRKTDFT